MPGINAIVRETGDGPYFEVKLSHIPQKGDLISLYSHLDKAEGYPATHHYEVVKVVHEIHDVTDKAPHSINDHHEVLVVVKQSNDPVFKET